MRTYETRLHLDDDTSLRVYAERFNRAIHAMHAQRSSGQASAKPSFMRAFDLTARQYNAVKNRLDAMTASAKELRPLRLADLQERLAAVARKIERESARESVRLEMLHHLKRRLDRLHNTIVRLESDETLRICFGSRKLFNAQHHLEKNGFSSHEEWQTAWRDARSSEFFVLGSKDETAGCQGCVMMHLGDDRFRLRLRTVGAMRSYATFDLRFVYGTEHLLGALECGQALSYRFKRDAKGWRVFVSTAVIPPERTTVRPAGCIGVDQNDGFVTVSQTDRFGNLVASQNLPLNTKHLGTKATTTCIAQVVKQIVADAVRTAKPISIERLNFAKKKAQLSYASASRNVMLSAFTYRQFAILLAARATDAGVELITMNPAYSSKIGRQKYARRYGLSVHMAAAFVLARRAQGFRDRYLSSDEKRRRSTREDAAVPVLVAKERRLRGRAKVEPGGPSPHGDPVRAERSEILRAAAGGIPVREGDSSPSSAMRVRRAS
ncbi:MAG TPA: IS200/IS605 family accessory protein TnpB-related protein [Candidatus Acidoferrales bacterium]|nr:IS200/IS605 family accessory protein TnpB-related protein [Candidatus Acidoferrales bacterium]